MKTLITAVALATSLATTAQASTFIITCELDVGTIDMVLSDQTLTVKGIEREWTRTTMDGVGEVVVVRMNKDYSLLMGNDASAGLYDINKGRFISSGSCDAVEAKEL